jgi:hypothetical protein
MLSAKPVGSGLHVIQWTASNAKAAPVITYTHCRQERCARAKVESTGSRIGSVLTRNVSERGVQLLSVAAVSDDELHEFSNQVRLGNLVVSLVKTKSAYNYKMSGVGGVCIQIGAFVLWTLFW